MINDKSYMILDKVLFIGPDLNDKGGISSVLKSYSENFPNFHHLPSNSRHGTLPGAFNLLGLLAALPFQRLKGRKILHIHGAMGKSWIRKNIIRKWGELWGFKSIFHCHACTACESFAAMGISKSKKKLDRYDAIIALSDYWKNYFDTTFGLGDKTFKVNNIVARAEGDTYPRRDDGVTRFLFLGQLGDRKGIFDILNAISSAGLTGFKLTVGGNGEVDRFKAEVARLGLGDRVEYVGWVTGDMKDRLLRQSDVMILPSYNEGLPISILEAMAYGKGVISTPVGGIPEVIADGVNGLLVAPGDTAAIAAAMKAYIDNKSLARTHGLASAAIVDGFYPEAVLSRLVEIYNKINV